jgi:hypothetical protein
MKNYYHVIEEGSNGKTATHGYYTKIADAKKEVARLSSFFEGVHFYVLETNSKKQPEIVTI